jgi:Protein of unknown function DUF2834
MKHRTLCWVYGAIALAALVATWSQNIRFFAQDDNDGLWGFIRDSYANPAAASITNDLLLIALAAFVFMAVESRRVGIRHVWVYMVGSLAIAVSVFFPLFLLARELKLAQAGSPESQQGS